MNFIPNEPRSARFPEAVDPEIGEENLHEAPTLPMLPDYPDPTDDPSE